MIPSPVGSLSHLTVPCAIRMFPLSLGGGGPPAKPRATMAGDSPRDRGEQQKSADEGPRPSRRSHSLEPSFVHVRKEPNFRVPENARRLAKDRNDCQGRFWCRGRGPAGGRGEKSRAPERSRARPLRR